MFQSETEQFQAEWMGQMIKWLTCFCLSLFLALLPLMSASFSDIFSRWLWIIFQFLFFWSASSVNLKRHEIHSLVLNKWVYR